MADGIARPVRLGVLALFLLLVGCGSDEGIATPPPPLDDAQRAVAYLNELLDIMQRNSINRLKIDWPAFRTSVLATGKDAKSIAETYAAIREALRLLGDGHSQYRSATGAFIFVPTRSCTAPNVTVPSVPAGIGYVRVGAFSGPGPDALAFANGIQAAIKAGDREGLTGWIVDLRGNTGGNMWPMIAGLGPILGEGVAGYFITPTDFRIPWEYRNGGSWSGGSLAQSVDTPYRLRVERPRVAVLTDGRVASSGEATAIAFRKRPDTRTFGTPSCGLSTGNSGFGLSDGATLVLTTVVMADRTGLPYGDVLVPDETVTDSDSALQRAITWLRTGY